MKIKLPAIALLLAMLLGTLGCTASPGKNLTAKEDDPHFIPASQSTLADNTSELLNLAATDENGDPLFQIVYDITAGLRVQEQCQTLAADILREIG